MMASLVVERSGVGAGGEHRAVTVDVREVEHVDRVGIRLVGERLVPSGKNPAKKFA